MLVVAQFSSAGKVQNACRSSQAARRDGETRPRDNGDVFESPGEFPRGKQALAKGHSWCQNILENVRISIVRKMTTVLRAGVQRCRHLLFERYGNSLSVMMCGQPP